jgi:hypothetical protein
VWYVDVSLACLSSGQSSKDRGVEGRKRWGNSRPKKIEEDEGRIYTYVGKKMEWLP